MLGRSLLGGGPHEGQHAPPSRVTGLTLEEGSIVRGDTADVVRDDSDDSDWGKSNECSCSPDKPGEVVLVTGSEQTLKAVRSLGDPP